MKKGVILFHSNIKNIYYDRWISKSIQSMMNQSDNNFIFYEVNYNGDDYSVIPNDCKLEKKFWSKKLDNYADAMNFILNKAFEDNCDYVFNMNLDDFYHEDRVLIQTKIMLEKKYDILSSNFYYIEETITNNGYEDIITQVFNMTEFSSINSEFKNGNNIIAHPSVCFSRKFWDDNKNRYNKNEIPEEDFKLWKESINNGYSFGITEEFLLFYRIHNKQISKRRLEDVY
jgi:hypothetical protein